MVDFETLIARIVRQDRHNKQLNELRSTMADYEQKIRNEADFIESSFLRDSFNSLKSDYNYIDIMDTLDGVVFQLVKSNTILVRRIEFLETHLKMIKKNIEK